MHLHVRTPIHTLLLSKCTVTSTALQPDSIRMALSKGPDMKASDDGGGADSAMCKDR